MEEQDRKKYINPESTGHNAISYLYEKKDIDTIKKNGVPINLKINKKDLEIFDFLASKFGIPRNWLIAELLESDIVDMFQSFNEKPKYELAQEADNEMTNKKMTHEYRGATWYWDVVHPDYDVDNPSTKGLADLNGSKNETR